MTCKKGNMEVTWRFDEYLDMMNERDDNIKYNVIVLWVYCTILHIWIYIPRRLQRSLRVSMIGHLKN